MTLTFLLFACSGGIGGGDSGPPSHSLHNDTDTDTDSGPPPDDSGDTSDPLPNPLTAMGDLVAAYGQTRAEHPTLVAKAPDIKTVGAIEADYAKQFGTFHGELTSLVAQAQGCKTAGAHLIELQRINDTLGQMQVEVTMHTDEHAPHIEVAECLASEPQHTKMMDASLGLLTTVVGDLQAAKLCEEREDAGG